MLSYMSLFTWTLFPPAALLIALLILPLPARVSRAVVGLCDAVLFWTPHPGMPGLSLFWLVFLISGLTFLLTLELLAERARDYYGNVKTDRALVRLLAEERNAWIAGCCTCLWVFLHRYRSLLKKYHKVVEERSEVSGGGGAGGWTQRLGGGGGGGMANSNKPTTLSQQQNQQQPQNQPPLYSEVVKGDAKPLSDPKIPAASSVVSPQEDKKKM